MDAGEWALEHLAHRVRERRIHVQQIGVDVLFLLISQRRQPRGRIDGVVPHEKHRRRVETVDQQAGLLVDTE